MHRTVSMFWEMYKWQIMLIYSISYIGFGKKLIGSYIKGDSRTTTTYNVVGTLVNGLLVNQLNKEFLLDVAGILDTLLILSTVLLYFNVTVF